MSCPERALAPPVQFIQLHFFGGLDSVQKSFLGTKQIPNSDRMLDLATVNLASISYMVIHAAPGIVSGCRSLNKFSASLGMLQKVNQKNNHFKTIEIGLTLIL